MIPGKDAKMAAGCNFSYLACFAIRNNLNFPIEVH
jgi:hypothetical protein